VVQDHSRGKISIRWNELLPWLEVTWVHPWLEVPQVPWSRLGGAGSLKGHEMTPWVKDQSYIMLVRAYSGG
jgi:hypothetical protein